MNCHQLWSGDLLDLFHENTLPCAKPWNFTSSLPRPLATERFETTAKTPFKATLPSSGQWKIWKLDCGKCSKPVVYHDYRLKNAPTTQWKAPCPQSRSSLETKDDNSMTTTFSKPQEQMVVPLRLLWIKVQRETTHRGGGGFCVVPIYLRPFAGSAAIVILVGWRILPWRILLRPFQAQAKQTSQGHKPNLNSALALHAFCGIIGIGRSFPVLGTFEIAIIFSLIWR